MLDFWKELIWEIKGYNVHEIKNEKQKKKSKIILSIGMKVVIDIMGIFYLVIAWICLDSSFKMKNYFSFFMYIIMVLLDLAILVLTNIKKINTEIAGIVCIVFFILLNMMIPIFSF